MRALNDHAWEKKLSIGAPKGQTYNLLSYLGVSSNNHANGNIRAYI